MPPADYIHAFRAYMDQNWPLPFIVTALKNKSLNMDNTCHKKYHLPKSSVLSSRKLFSGHVNRSGTLFLHLLVLLWAQITFRLIRIKWLQLHILKITNYRPTLTEVVKKPCQIQNKLKIHNRSSNYSKSFTLLELPDTKKPQYIDSALNYWPQIMFI